FPTHIKLGARADTVIANGAMCEPLLHGDAYLMEKEAGLLVEGISAVMKAVGAGRSIIALKARHGRARSSMEEAARAANRVSVEMIDDVYPAGDEHILVYELTGRIAPAGGLPVAVGVVVSNIETLVNVAQALSGEAVTSKVVSVMGEVESPVTAAFPVGTVLEEAITFAGGVTAEDPVILVGGPMMGRVTTDLSESITKTTSSLLVLPADHPVVIRKTLDVAEILRRARSACYQCRFCTDICPRYLLGHDIEPHRVMRAISLGPPDDYGIVTAALCSECNLCESYACNMGLSVSTVVRKVKAELASQGWRPEDEKREQTRLNSVPLASIPFSPHKQREGRKVPTERLIHRLGLAKYKGRPMREDTFSGPVAVRIPLKQHVGDPSVPVVKVAQAVSQGELIAETQDGKLGARIHSSISGTVTETSENEIRISRIDT
ncbi:4Fe-4S dicluster domain-containing protein, partial [Candidatus Hydrogenedentota bacterium]